MFTKYLLESNTVSGGGKQIYKSWYSLKEFMDYLED